MIQTFYESNDKALLHSNLNDLLTITKAGEFYLDHALTLPATNPTPLAPSITTSTNSFKLDKLFTHSSYFQTSDIHSLIAYIAQIPISPTRYTHINDLAMIKLLLQQALQTPELFNEDVPSWQTEAFCIINSPDKPKVLLVCYKFYNQPHFIYFSMPMFAPGETIFNKVIYTPSLLSTL